MSVKIRMHLEGVSRVTSTFRALPESVRKHARVAVRETTRAVEQGAKMRAPVSAGGRTSRKGNRRPGPGELRDTIRSTVWDFPDGITGFVNVGHGKLKRRLKGKNARTEKVRRERKKARGRKQMGPLTVDQANIGAYGMVVEYGDKRRGRPAKPFLRPALEAQRQPHRQRMERAVNQATAEAQKELGRAG
jgi:hypothetical protein